MYKFDTLETERLILKKVTPEIYEYLFKNFEDAELMYELGLNTAEQLQIEKQKSNGGYKTYDRTMITFFMQLKSNGETIGRCGFHNWYSLHRRAEIGYILQTEKYRRMGYMTEAVAAVIKIGFTELGLNRIEATASPLNTASVSIIKKNGFMQEGYLRQHYNNGNTILDSLLFSLIRDDYFKE